MNWHLLSIDEVSRQLETAPSGLEEHNASKKLAQFGKNEIIHKKRTRFCGCCCDN